MRPARYSIAARRGNSTSRRLIPHTTCHLQQPWPGWFVATFVALITSKFGNSWDSPSALPIKRF
jgi:hypothetical protein